MDKIITNVGKERVSYVDNMVVKTKEPSGHYFDLKELFNTIEKY